MKRTFVVASLFLIGFMAACEQSQTGLSGIFEEDEPAVAARELGDGPMTRNERPEPKPKPKPKPKPPRPPQEGTRLPGTNFWCIQTPNGDKCTMIKDDYSLKDKALFKDKDGNWPAINPPRGMVFCNVTTTRTSNPAGASLEVEWNRNSVHRIWARVNDGRVAFTITAVTVPAGAVSKFNCPPIYNPNSALCSCPAKFIISLPQDDTAPYAIACARQKDKNHKDCINVMAWCSRANECDNRRCKELNREFFYYPQAPVCIHNP